MTSTISDLDNDILEVINERHLDDREKWLQYQKILQRYIHFSNQD